MTLEKRQGPLTYKSQPKVAAVTLGEDVWNILLVDDEEDIHAVTRLALRNKTWRRRPFRLHHAHSAAEAQKLLSETSEPFNVAIIDVVMETDDAGLKLSSWIRTFCANSLRIILRTGQAGVAPEHYVLNEYDIDYYVAKTEVDVDRLYRVVCSALRSSQDIATLLSFGAQLRNFTTALQRVASLEDLLLFMSEGLQFVGLKYGARVEFMHDLPDALARASADSPEATRARHLLALHERGASRLAPLLPKEHGLGEAAVIMLFDVVIDSTQVGSEDAPVLGAVRVDFAAAASMTTNAVDGLARDLTLFIENWKGAYVALRLQQRIAQERMLREQMYHDRLQMIANMVAGVAHEINTPLGVASTANSMIAGLASDLLDRLKHGKPASDVVTDLEEATRLMAKNLERAHHLIKSFKQLSSSQLSDERVRTSVESVVRDCVETLSPETRKRGLQIELQAAPQSVWNGYAGYLGQVVINIIQNVLRYAYPDGPGKMSIRITTVMRGSTESYRVDFQDWGRGIPAKILPRVFDPFVTTGRAIGGTGLGLAISKNIVNDLLHGSIGCESVEGQGTTFTLTIPADVPVPASLPQHRSAPPGAYVPVR